MHTHLVALAGLLAAVANTGCTSQTAYASGQAWQQGQCNKIVDMQERERCLVPTRQPYDRYEKQAAELKKNGAPE